MTDTFLREIEIRFKGPRRSAAGSFGQPAAAADFFRGLIGDDVRESFIAAYLDARHKPFGWRTVSVGTLTASLVHPREVFQAAVAQSAAAVIVAHNHPSGDAQPSAEDGVVTERLIEAGKILGITLLDHIVIGESGFISFREQSGLFG